MKDKEEDCDTAGSIMRELSKFDLALKIRFAVDSSSRLGIASVYEYEGILWIDLVEVEK